MTAFYNEIDPYAAQWLENLISAGHITPGKVERKSIHDLRADELTGYERAHFFAGIAGWDLALQLAGWPAGHPVWTGSCPCQPFSAAGKRNGVLDARHLWPDFYALVRASMPPTIFGEQVASADGRLWLDGVRADLEALGYAFGAADLCAAGIGAPHIRQRLYWVAYSQGERFNRSKDSTWPDRWASVKNRGDAGGLEYPDKERRDGERLHVREWGSQQGGIEVAGTGQDSGPYRKSPWSRFDTIPCLDGKTRRIEPGSFPLAHGVPARVGKLRAYGNAIVPQLAAEFIAAFLETEGVTHA